MCFQYFDLRYNYIGKLAKNTFTAYPAVKKLLLNYNKVHTIEVGALGALSKLELLDLSHNAVDRLPGDLPGTLRELYLDGNPLKNVRNLSHASGLRILSLRNCDLDRFPTLGVQPDLVKLDVSHNPQIEDLEPEQLANACRLTLLDVTGTRLFPAGRRGSHCRCHRIVEWTTVNKIRLIGLDICPEPVKDDRDYSPNDPMSAMCACASDAAYDANKACVAEWDRRHASHWFLWTVAAVAAVGMAAICCDCVKRSIRYYKLKYRHENREKKQMDDGIQPTYRANEMVVDLYV